MQVSIPFLSDTDCINTYPEVKPEIKVCGGEYNKTTCNVFIIKNLILMIFLLNLIFKREIAEDLLLSKVKI
jgi:hypothetical protein